MSTPPAPYTIVPEIRSVLEYRVTRGAMILHAGIATREEAERLALGYSFWDLVVAARTASVPGLCLHPEIREVYRPVGACAAVPTSVLPHAWGWGCLQCGAEWAHNARPAPRNVHG